MNKSKVVFSKHAITQMFERDISVDDIEKCLEGETIEVYSEDNPYPSRLIFMICKNRPIHVVIAENSDDKEIIVVTAYEPTLFLWELGFRKWKLK